MADDFVEENKLLGQGSEKLLLLRQGDYDEVDGEQSGDNEETLAHLRECVKRERDQKVYKLGTLGKVTATWIVFAHAQNYFEELVSVRDTQLAKVQRELVACSAESERQKKDLESIVLELQGQV